MNKQANEVTGTGQMIYQTLWGGPEKMESYVDLAIRFHNEQNGMGDHRKIRKEDVDNITSPVMCSLVSTLLKELDGTFDNRPQTDTLPEFAALRVTEGPCTYDSTIEHIFVEASKYFNLADDLLDIGLFWFPENNVTRAKHVIAWLTAYCIFVDNYGDKGFKERYENLIQEVKDKCRLADGLSDDIEEIQAAIDQPALEADEGLASIKEELEDVTTKLQRAYKELNEIEEVEIKEKANFDAKASELRDLETQLREMDAEEASLRDQLADSPLEVLQAHKAEADELQEALNARSELGRQMQEIGADQQKSLALLERVKNSHESWEFLLESIDKAECRDIALKNAEQDLLIKMTEKKKLKNKINNIKDEKTSFQRKIQSEWSSRLRMVKSTELELEQYTVDGNVLQDEILKLEGEILFMKKQIEEKERKIHEYQEFFEKHQKNYNIAEIQYSILQMVGIQDVAKVNPN